jgi:O-antigen/teichoic acid export membrane protein
MSLVRRVATVGAGTALAQLIAAASTPLLTRVFAPEAHAVWAVFLSSSIIFSAVATLRYELAVVLPKSRREAAALVQVGLAAATGVAALSGLAAWLWGSRLFPAGEAVIIRHAVWAVPVSVLSTAATQLAFAWCTREAAFGAYSFAQFLLPSATLAAQLAFAALGWRDAAGLVFGTVAGQALAALVLAFALVRRGGPGSVESAVRGREIALRYRNYPLYMTPYTLLGTFRDRLAYFMLGRLGMPAEAGFYNLAARLINLPNSFVASALRPVFFAHAAGHDPRELERPVRELVVLLGLLCGVMWGPAVVFAPTLLRFVFGPGWDAAAPFAIVLSVPAIPLLMGNWADRLLDVLGRQRTALTLELLSSTAVVGGLLGGYAISGNLLIAVAFQSFCLTVYYVIWLMVLFRAAGFAIRPLLGGLGGVLAAGTISWLLSRGMATAAPAIAIPASFLLAAAAGAWAALRARRQLRNFLGSSPASIDN